MEPQNRLRRRWHAFVRGLVVPLLALCLVHGYRPPLSPLETRLVGEWYYDQPRDTRSFWPDRTFSTSNGQFVGTWHIADKQLTVTYWQRYELPMELSMAAVGHSIRRVRKETISWELTLTEDGRRLIFHVPVSADCPDGKWLWHRAGDE